VTSTELPSCSSAIVLMIVSTPFTRTVIFCFIEKKYMQCNIDHSKNRVKWLIFRQSLKNCFFEDKCTFNINFYSNIHVCAKLWLYKALFLKRNIFLCFLLPNIYICICFLLHNTVTSKCIYHLMDTFATSQYRSTWWQSVKFQIFCRFFTFCLKLGMTIDHKCKYK
jgi:hypothetical protein